MKLLRLNEHPSTALMEVYSPYGAFDISAPHKKWALDEAARGYSPAAVRQGSGR